MKMYNPDNDKKRLAFNNHSFKSPAQEFCAVMTILRNGGCEYESEYLLPENKIYRLTLNGTEFIIMTDNFDRSGCILCTNDEETMVLIEKIFTDAGIERCADE